MALGYLMVGTTDIERAEVFYREVLGVLGAQKDDANSSEDQILFFQEGGVCPILDLRRRLDGSRTNRAADTRFALPAPNRSVVHNVHTIALDMGGRSEELPQFSTAAGYSAWFSDLDSNRI